MNHGCWIMLVFCALANPHGANAEGNRELKVHLAQANNHSPYAFVRAKFEPGELSDPWAVRFFDDKGVEVPYFVWDSVTWQVAREGRADWGHRYALINHAPGNSPDALAGRGRKLQWAKKSLPELGTKLEAQEEAAKKAGDSVCAAMYLLRHSVPALGKERLTLRIYPDLPDHIRVTWKGKELFHSAGFDAGGTADAASHADPSRPFAVESTEGIVTKLFISGQKVAPGWGHGLAVYVLALSRSSSAEFVG